MSEYGWSLDYVLYTLPLQQAFALYAAIAVRYGNEPKGPTYADLDLREELDRVGLPPPSGGYRARRRERLHNQRPCHGPRDA